MPNNLQRIFCSNYAAYSAVRSGKDGIRTHRIYLKKKLTGKACKDINHFMLTMGCGAATAHGLDSKKFLRSFFQKATACFTRSWS
jgi:hypothetical protein